MIRIIRAIKLKEIIKIKIAMYTWARSVYEARDCFRWGYLGRHH